MKRIIVIMLLLLSSFIFFQYIFKQDDTKFGKRYNPIRLEYGSPIIHDYLELEFANDTRECWGIPKEIHDTIRTGFHEGKCFNIANDSVLYEDDIFRKRINDSTFIFIAILTYGNRHENYYKAIYYDTADVRSLNFDVPENLKKNKDINYYNHKPLDLTIEQADSTLNQWGTSRTK